MKQSLPNLFFSNQTNGGCDLPHQCKGDGCHPDDAGHRAIAEVVQAALTIAFEPKTAPTPTPSPGMRTIAPAPAPAKCSIKIDTSKSSHTISRLTTGCHHDAGYHHQNRGLYAEMLSSTAFQPVPVVGVPLSAQGEATLADTTAVVEEGRGGGGVVAGSATGWFADVSGGPTRTAVIDSSTKFIATSNGSVLLPAPGAAVTNRGLGGEGLVLSGGKEYVGFAYVKAAAAATVTVTLQTWYKEGRPSPSAAVQAGTVLAKYVVLVPPSNASWVRVNFSLIPTTDAGCIGVADGDAAAQGVSCPNEDKTPAHICVKCGAVLRLQYSNTITATATATATTTTAADTTHPSRAAAATPPPPPPPLAAAAASLHVGFVSLMPGKWGLHNNLPILKSGAETLKKMGVRLVRFGGSYADGTNMNWKKWRGPAPNRQVTFENKQKQKQKQNPSILPVFPHFTCRMKTKH